MLAGFVSAKTGENTEKVIREFAFNILKKKVELIQLKDTYMTMLLHLNEDFDDDLASGASHADFVAGNYGMKLPAREVEWGGGTFALLGVSTVALILATVMGADLLQSVFVGGQTYSGLAGTIGGMLGN